MIAEDVNVPDPATARYDRIGSNYADFRRPDPLWATEIRSALGNADWVLNVGAGTGNYEDPSRNVVAAEPSQVMLDQRKPQSAPAVRAVAEALPFADDSFDATMAVLTIHHWADRDAGLRELARLAPWHVLSVYEPLDAHSFWLMDYFPELAETPMERNAPTPADLDGILRVVDVRTLWVTRDCPAGFLAASWARPHDYLDPDMQRAISLLAMAPPEVRERGMSRLAADLESGAWHGRYGHLLEQDRADFGYRLAIAERR